MKNIITLLLSILSMMTLASCMSEFEPDIESTPVVCINANAVVGDTLLVEVTRTWRWSEGHVVGDFYNENDIDIFLREADVEVWVNGELRCRPKFCESTVPYPSWMLPHGWHVKGYQTDYVPSPGDHIYIKVHDAEYGDAEGEVTVPMPTKIDGVTFSTTLIDDPDLINSKYYGDMSKDDFAAVSGNVSFNIQMTDPDDILNYYKLEMHLLVREKEGLPLISKTYFNFDQEPLFTEHVSSLESVFSETYGYHFFSDRQISGQPYVLRVSADETQYSYLKEEGASSNQSCIQLKLCTISESYYKHVISMWQSNDGVPGALGGIGLGEPVWMESNVSTGAGVISASSSSEVNIPMSELFGIK